MLVDADSSPCGEPGCYVCEHLNPGFATHFPTWADILQLALFSLSCIRNNDKLYYSLGEEIYPFIDRHWYRLCSKPRNSTWRQTAKMTLAHSRYADLFENGYDQLLKTGYWRLKNVSREAIEQLSANVSTSGRGSPHNSALAGNVNANNSASSLASTAASPLQSSGAASHVLGGSPASALHLSALHGGLLHSPIHFGVSPQASAAAASLLASPSHILNMKYGMNGTSAPGLGARVAGHGDEQMSILASLAMAEGAEELNTVNSLTALSASSQSVTTSSTTKTHASMMEDLEDFAVQHAADRRRAMSAQFRPSPGNAADVHAPTDSQLHQMRKEYHHLESKFKALDNEHRAALLQLEKYHSLLIASMRQDETSRMAFARQSELQEGQVRLLADKVQRLEYELAQRKGASPSSPTATTTPSAGAAPSPSQSNAASIAGANSANASLANANLMQALAAMHAASAGSGAANPAATAANMQSLMQANALQASLMQATGNAGAVANGIPQALAFLQQAQQQQQQQHLAATAHHPISLFGVGLPTKSTPPSPAVSASAAAPSGLAAGANNSPTTVTAAALQAAAVAGFPAAALYGRNALPWLTTANGLNPIGWTFAGGDALTAANMMAVASVGGAAKLNGAALYGAASPAPSAAASPLALGNVVTANMGNIPNAGASTTTTAAGASPAAISLNASVSSVSTDSSSGSPNTSSSNVNKSSDVEEKTMKAEATETAASALESTASSSSGTANPSQVSVLPLSQVKMEVDEESKTEATTLPSPNQNASTAVAAGGSTPSSAATESTASCPSSPAPSTASNRASADVPITPQPLAA